MSNQDERVTIIPAQPGFFLIILRIIDSKGGEFTSSDVVKMSVIAWRIEGDARHAEPITTANHHHLYGSSDEETSYFEGLLGPSGVVFEIVNYGHGPHRSQVTRVYPNMNAAIDSWAGGFGISDEHIREARKAFAA